MFQLNLAKQSMFKSCSSMLRNPISQIASRRIGTPQSLLIRRSAFHSSSFAATTRPLSKSVFPRLALASSIAFVSYTSFKLQSPIRNDAALQVPTVDIKVSKKPAAVHKSRFHGYLDYRELCIGSVTGLILGVVIGKFSSALVFLSLASYFLVQFLEANNIVVIPWKKIIRVGTEDIEVKELVLSNPSFKLSFVSSFLIAAFNI